jgi:hypothetical protein
MRIFYRFCQALGRLWCVPCGIDPQILIKAMCNHMQKNGIFLGVKLTSCNKASILQRF